jgi:D-threo-aldose 1-dehydrogenase
LRFPLGHPAVRAIVVGAGSVAHVTEVVDLFETEIPDALWVDLTDNGLLPPGTPVPGGRAA